MKEPEECTNIDEIRFNIDTLDRRIIFDIGSRYEYVKAASKFKKNVAEVKSDDRVKKMLEIRKLWAEDCGLNPQFIEDLYTRMVDHFVKEELKNWKREQTVIKTAVIEDLPEILSLQKLAYISEADIVGDYNIPPMTQTIEAILDEFKEKTFIKAVNNGRIIGSVRALEKEGSCYIGRVIVHPDFQNLGIGARLMKEIEVVFNSVRRFELFTGFKSEKNLYFYGKHGYTIFKSEGVNEKLKFVYLEKIV